MTLAIPDIFPGDYPDFDGTQLCANGDPDRFFPDKGVHGEALRVIAATCRACSWRGPCATWAIRNREGYGIWGGTSANERQRLAAS